MSEYFTYIIRSNNRTDTNDSTNNCFIQLAGLPTNFRNFECEVVNFYIGTITPALSAASYVELKAVDLDFKNGYDTQHKNLKTLAFTTKDNASPSTGLKFIVGNFNSKTINFQLSNEYSDILVDYNVPWTLVLKMRGVN